MLSQLPAAMDRKMKQQYNWKKSSSAVSDIEFLFCMGDIVGWYCYEAGIEATRTVLITVTEQYHKNLLTMVNDANDFYFVFLYIFTLKHAF